MIAILLRLDVHLYSAAFCLAVRPASLRPASRELVVEDKQRLPVLRQIDAALRARFPKRAQPMLLAYPKFRLDAQEQHELLANYLPYAEVVRIAPPPPTAPVCRDPCRFRTWQLPAGPTPWSPETPTC